MEGPLRVNQVISRTEPKVLKSASRKRFYPHACTVSLKYCSSLTSSLQKNNKRMQDSKARAIVIIPTQSSIFHFVDMVALDSLCCTYQDPIIFRSEPELSFTALGLKFAHSTDGKPVSSCASLFGLVKTNPCGEDVCPRSQRVNNSFVAGT